MNLVTLNIFGKVVLCLDIESQQAIFLSLVEVYRDWTRFEATEEVLMENMFMLFIAALYNILR